MTLKNTPGCPCCDSLSKQPCCDTPCVTCVTCAERQFNQKKLIVKDDFGSHYLSPTYLDQNLYYSTEYIKLASNILTGWFKLMCGRDNIPDYEPYGRCAYYVYGCGDTPVSRTFIYTENGGWHFVYSPSCDSWNLILVSRAEWENYRDALTPYSQQYIDIFGDMSGTAYNTYEVLHSPGFLCDNTLFSFFCANGISMLQDAYVRVQYSVWCWGPDQFLVRRIYRIGPNPLDGNKWYPLAANVVDNNLVNTDSGYHLLLPTKTDFIGDSDPALTDGYAPRAAYFGGAYMFQECFLQVDSCNSDIITATGNLGDKQRTAFGVNNPIPLTQIGQTLLSDTITLSFATNDSFKCCPGNIYCKVCEGSLSNIGTIADANGTHEISNIDSLGKWSVCYAATVANNAATCVDADNNPSRAGGHDIYTADTVKVIYSVVCTDDDKIKVTCSYPVINLDLDPKPTQQRKNAYAYSNCDNPETLFPPCMGSKIISWSATGKPTSCDPVTLNLTLKSDVSGIINKAQPPGGTDIVLTIPKSAPMPNKLFLNLTITEGGNDNSVGIALTYDKTKRKWLTDCFRVPNIEANGYMATLDCVSRLRFSLKSMGLNCVEGVIKSYEYLTCSSDNCSVMSLSKMSSDPFMLIFKVTDGDKHITATITE